MLFFFIAFLRLSLFCFSAHFSSSASWCWESNIDSPMDRVALATAARYHQQQQPRQYNYKKNARAYVIGTLAILSEPVARTAWLSNFIWRPPIASAAVVGHRGAHPSVRPAGWAKQIKDMRPRALAASWPSAYTHRHTATYYYNVVVVVVDVLRY